MKGWVKVHTGSKLPYVSMVKHLLESNEIPVIQLNKQDSSYLFGEIELYVRNEDVVKTNFLLSKLSDE